MSQGSLNPKIRLLGQKMCYVARERTHTHRQTHTKVTTVGTLSGFHEFFLQPIIKDRPYKVISSMPWFNHQPPYIGPIKIDVFFLITPLDHEENDMFVFPLF